MLSDPEEGDKRHLFWFGSIDSIAREQGGVSDGDSVADDDIGCDAGGRVGVCGDKRVGVRDGTTE
jgi:hypothetical protein